MANNSTPNYGGEYNVSYHNPHISYPMDDNTGLDLPLPGTNTLHPGFYLDLGPYLPSSFMGVYPEFGIDIIYDCSGALVYYLPAVICNADISTCSCGATPTGRFMNDFNNSCCSSNIGRDFYETWYDAAADCPAYIKYNLKESLGQVCVGLYWQGVAL
jgi:hypothetical protein